MPVIECDVEDARARLRDAGAAFQDGKAEHERWHADLGEAHAVAYEGKVVVQGSRPADITSVLASEQSGRVHAYFDGACRGNPGPSAIGWVLVDGDGIVDEGGERIGRATNNQAEYEALIRVLEVADRYGYDEVEVRGDSQLIVKQVKGAWNTNDPELRELRVRVHELLERFDDWSIAHVPREVNDRADDRANEALDDG
ncbi:ribonuclease HI [Halanaeroarchaeum sulfurireducens]|uniref:Ribonuclease H n=1 Tax=Halanaeroarchaeum sulfurireducens TaxID=1604004 RepID=A0A0F7P796_9EURY|nr:ribonuclease HI [Halanaeroarchaeum sulfurireducens]AKH97081.1 ribonuclease H [Halanaeroarchaeum sulfurireducens]ALG81482.1 ribonuclease H [Halanaeroarchaeum sulfurireducens]